MGAAGILHADHMAEPDVPEVSILVPAKNEEATIAAVVERLLALPLRKQIVVVDDASTDRTVKVLEPYFDKITFVSNPDPGGKGKAIRAGLKYATGEVVVIQDADLEYLPEELPLVVCPIIEGNASVVYGSRFTRGMNKEMALPNKVVNVLLAWMTRILYGQKITDEATCYKAFRRDLLEKMHLECQRFEFCPEVTAKASRLGETIKEVPVSYHPRNVAEGKKIRWTDGVEAFWTLFRHRFGKF